MARIFVRRIAVPFLLLLSFFSFFSALSIQLWDLGSTVSSPSGSGQTLANKRFLVNLEHKMLYRYLIDNNCFGFDCMFCQLNVEPPLFQGGGWRGSLKPVPPP